MMFLWCNVYRAMQSFSEVLTVAPEFTRRCEIHIRLGVLFKTKGDYHNSVHHFKQAANMSGPASISKSESKQRNNSQCFMHNEIISAICNCTE